jgi:hypothetical protein
MSNCWKEEILILMKLVEEESAWISVFFKRCFIFLIPRSIRISSNSLKMCPLQGCCSFYPIYYYSWFLGIWTQAHMTSTSENAVPLQLQDNTVIPIFSPPPTSKRDNLKELSTARPLKRLKFVCRTRRIMNL